MRAKSKDKAKKQTKKLDLDNASPSQLFNYLNAGQQQMDQQIFAKFFTQILGLDQENILQFYLLSIGMKSPKSGHITLSHFQNLFVFAGKCKNLKEFKKLLPKLQNDLKDSKIYRQMYKSLYQVFLIKNASMDFQYAETLWGVLLKKDFVYYKQFFMYLKELGNKKPTKCHKDLWQMTYQFALCVKDATKNYNISDGWPVFLDNFVQFMKEKQLIKQ